MTGHRTPSEWPAWLGLPADCGFETIAPGVRVTTGPSGPLTWLSLPAAADSLETIVAGWLAGADDRARLIPVDDQRPPHRLQPDQQP